MAVCAYYCPQFYEQIFESVYICRTFNLRIYISLGKVIRTQIANDIFYFSHFFQLALKLGPITGDMFEIGFDVSTLLANNSGNEKILKFYGIYSKFHNFYLCNARSFISKLQEVVKYDNVFLKRAYIFQYNTDTISELIM